MRFLYHKPLTLFSILFTAFTANAYAASWLEHTVSSGENLTLISNKYHVSVNSIVAWNSLKNANSIYAGQKLRIQSDRSSSSGKHFSAPVDRMRPIRGYVPVGDEQSHGLWLRIAGTSEIRAAAGGKVIKVSEYRGYGRYILVDHGGGWMTMYSHLDSIYVRRGSQVKEKQPIGQGSGKIFFLIAYQGKPVNPAKNL